MANPAWFNRFGQEWAKSGNTDDPTTAQANAGWAYIGQAPPTVEQFNSINQWTDDKDNWLYGQIANVIASANMLPDPTDLTQLLRAITSKQKILLATDLNLYIDAVNGNDTTGDGTPGKPFKTIQHCFEWTKTYIEPAGHGVFCNLKPGTYASFDARGTTIPYFIVIGDRLNPRAYVIKNTTGAAITAWFGTLIYVLGVSVEAVGIDSDYTTAGFGLLGANGGFISYQDVAFGPCSNAHMCAQAAGNVYSNGPISYSIYGAARSHILSVNGGIVTSVQSAVTIQNNPAFSVAFAIAQTLGILQAWSTTYTGTAQGCRALVTTNAIVAINSANPATYFPGTTAPVSSSGGLFV